jgi:hypothetical protein
MNFIIFSVFQSSNTHENNLYNHFGTIAALSALGIEHTIVNGVYNGTNETSIKVDAKFEAMIRALSLQYNQECYLKVSDGLGALFTPNAELMATLGHWTETDDIPESYTEIDGKRFVCMPESIPQTMGA